MFFGRSAEIQHWFVANRKKIASSARNSGSGPGSGSAKASATAWGRLKGGLKLGGEGSGGPKKGSVLTSIFSSLGRSSALKAAAGGSTNSLKAAKT